MDSIPSRSVPVVMRALILINVVVFFELALPQEALKQIFYLFDIVPTVLNIPSGRHGRGFP